MLAQVVLISQPASNKLSKGAEISKDHPLALKTGIASLLLLIAQDATQRFQLEI